MFQTRRELSQLSGAYERFSPEGQKRLSQLEARLQDLQTKYENNVKATQDRDTHLEAIRQQIDSPDYQPPFSPELYRLALETATPNGWDSGPLFAENENGELDVNPAFYDNAKESIVEGVQNDTVHLDEVQDPLVDREIQLGTKENPIHIHLKYKPEWTAEQRAQADAKLKALSEAYTEKTIVTKRKQVRNKFKKAFNMSEIPMGYDVDHIIDLQLGGTNDIMNLQLLDSSVNRSLGVQIAKAISQYDVGTVFGNFSID